MNEPARAYKDVIGGLSEAAEELRERERALAVDLAGRLVTLHRAMVEAADRSAAARIGVRLQWDDVLDALWTESWLKLRPRPDPPPDPELAGRLVELTAAVEARSAELQAAAKRRFGRPGR